MGNLINNNPDLIPPLALERRKWTHCSHGHEFTPGNTRIRPNGTRYCLACDAARKEKFKAARAASKVASF